MSLALNKLSTLLELPLREVFLLLSEKQGMQKNTPKKGVNWVNHASPVPSSVVPAPFGSRPSFVRLGLWLHLGAL